MTPEEKREREHPTLRFLLWLALVASVALGLYLPFFTVVLILGGRIPV